MRILYGIIGLILIYLVLRMIYSVHYVGGESIYDSPTAQWLFPGLRRMFPSWGYGPDGIVKGNSHRLWPKSQSYEPTASGSGGVKPLGESNTYGAMREAPPTYPVVLRDGYDPLPTIQNIYDTETLPERTVWDIGQSI